MIVMIKIYLYTRRFWLTHIEETFLGFNDHYGMNIGLTNKEKNVQSSWNFPLLGETGFMDFKRRTWYQNFPGRNVSCGILKLYIYNIVIYIVLHYIKNKSGKFA